MSVLRAIMSTEGVGGLYRGINNKLLKSMSQKFIYFYLFKYLSDRVRTMHKVKNPGSGALVVIGFLGELLGLPLIIPLEAVVTKVQMAKAGEPTGFVSVLRTFEERRRRGAGRGGRKAGALPWCVVLCACVLYAVCCVLRT